MENPKKVGYLLLVLFGGLGFVILIVSIQVNDFSFLLYFFACLGIFIILSLIFGIVNVAVFGPVFWLLEKMTGKRSTGNSGEQKPE